MKRIWLIEEHSTEYDRDKQPQQWEDDRVDYVHCIRQVIRRPMNPMAGADIEEMEKGLRVLKALDGKKTGDMLELEDADWQHLCDKARSFRWGVIDARLVRFTHTLINAGEWPPDYVNGSNGHALTERLDGDRQPV